MAAPFTEQITFLAVADLDRAAAFYGGVLQLDLVEDQGDCLIYRCGGDAFIGICARSQRAKADGVIVTLVTADVDGWHERLLAHGVVCDTEPRQHPEYRIYQAFYRDPDGYVIEIQRFDDPDWLRSG